MAAVSVAAAAAAVAAGTVLLSGLALELPVVPTWSHCLRRVAHVFRSACRDRLPSDHQHHCCEEPEELEGCDTANEETRSHSQGHCLSSCSADPSGAFSAVRIDYSDQNGSTWLGFDLQGDDEEMTVKREILDPWAFADP